ncbi:MAG TPA: DPP IV N-terminal domain-containing protein [Steroidobacter sp.]
MKQTRWCALLVALLSACIDTASAGQVDENDYARAASFLPFNLMDKVRNSRVDPHWLDGGKRFWYWRDTAGGREVVLVDSATGKRQSLAKPPGSEAKSVVAPEGTVLSPDGSLAVFVREHDLWLRQMSNGAERRLTNDGEEYFAYGKLVDTSLRAIPMRRATTPASPSDVEWSPDSRSILVTRTDERRLGRYPFLESVPSDGSARPVAHELRVALPGDRNKPIEHRSVIDVASGEQRPFNVPLPEFSIRGGEWSADGRHYYFFGISGHKTAGVFDLDVDTAQVREVLSESSDTFISLNNTLYSGPNIRILPRSHEVIWFSEADGWGHLYLYDLRTGKLKNRLTSGEWLVRDVIHVDSERRVVYFTAAGREPGRNPYYRHLYRIGFDGRGEQLLTPEQGDHEITQPLDAAFAAALGGGASVLAVAPNGRFFVDTWSTVDRPPVSVLRTTEGKLIATLEKADATALYATGWQPPEPFVAKAADGITDLYGLLYRPTNFDRNARYPVIEHLYGGPQIAITARTFMQAVMDPKYVNAEKELGFVMVVMDVRGTVKRSKAFGNHLYQNYGDYMIEDHVAVLKQLATRYPFMDLDRVGVEGHSFGGYGAAHAMLSRPDFYKVGVASAGSHNYQGMYPVTYLGEPVYSDGQSINPTGLEIPENYRSADNGALAERLRGKLMIVYGDLDENAYPAVTLQFADALIKANKSFDLLYLPGRTHDFARTDFYFIRRKWDYFVEHLLGAKPPDNYRIVAPPPAKWRSALQ